MGGGGGGGSGGRGYDLGVTLIFVGREYRESVDVLARRFIITQVYLLPVRNIKMHRYLQSVAGIYWSSSHDSRIGCI